MPEELNTLFDEYNYAWRWYTAQAKWWTAKTTLIPPKQFETMPEVSKEIRYPSGSADMKTIMASVQARR